MGIMMGPNGQLINTSNIGGIVGSNLIPNITPNIGALANVGNSVIPSSTTNEDGTITIPTIELKSRETGLDLGEMQNLYGTKYMPMFQFIEAQQTGSMTYDPADDNLASTEELEAIRADFEKEHGMSAEQALLRAKAERAGQKVAGATAATVGSAFAQSKIGGAPFGTAAIDAAGSVVPFKGLFQDPPANVMLDNKPVFLNPQEYAMQKDLGANLTALKPEDAPTDFLQVGEGLMNPAGSTIQDRLYGSPAAFQNFKVSAASGVADAVTQIAMGADPMDAIKDAAKSATLSYVANAIIPGSGPIVSFLSKFF